MAVGADQAEAISNFVEEAYSLTFALSDLITRDEATDQECELFARLAKPILDAMRRDQEANQKRESRLIDFPRLRRERGDHGTGWRQAFGQGKPNRLSTA
jgi:hypothetical protein